MKNSALHVGDEAQNTPRDSDKLRVVSYFGIRFSSIGQQKISARVEFLNYKHLAFFDLQG